MAELKIQNLTKTFSDRKRKTVEAVKDVSLEVGDGEFLVIVGPSGCGKSTLLRLIAGLEEADAGNIQIEERDVTNVHPKDRDVAMVFQNYALFPHMTVFENMAFSLRFRKVAKANIRERVLEAAEMLHLEELLERKPQELSGGQRQRVAVGRAIVRHPKLFLFDEPLSNLDAKMRTELRAELSRLHQRLKTTMIYVTHDQMEAMTLGNRICVLNEGRIMQTGEPLEVYRNPHNTFVAEFIGNPGANLLRGTLAKVESRLEFQLAASNDRQSIPLGDRFHAIKHIDTSQEIILGIRPESVTVTQNESEGAHNGSLPGVLEINETIGHEALLHLRIGTEVIKARANAEQGFQLNQRASVTFDPNGIRLFDAHTGNALSMTNDEKF